jgi:hypothetical protein
MSLDRRNTATRPAHTVHEDIRAQRLASMIASSRRLVAMGEDELRRIDAGEYSATPKHREHVARELEIHRGWLADLTAEASPLRAAAE